MLSGRLAGHNNPSFGRAPRSRHAREAGADNRRHQRTWSLASRGCITLLCKPESCRNADTSCSNKTLVSSCFFKIIPKCCVTTLEYVFIGNLLASTYVILMTILIMQPLQRHAFKILAHRWIATSFVFNLSFLTPLKGAGRVECNLDSPSHGLRTKRIQKVQVLDGTCTNHYQPFGIDGSIHQKGTGHEGNTLCLRCCSMTSSWHRSLL